MCPRAARALMLSCPRARVPPPCAPALLPSHAFPCAPPPQELHGLDSTDSAEVATAQRLFSEVRTALRSGVHVLVVHDCRDAVSTEHISSRTKAYQSSTLRAGLRNEHEPWPRRWVRAVQARLPFAAMREKATLLDRDSRTSANAKRGGRRRSTVSPFAKSMKFWDAPAGADGSADGQPSSEVEEELCHDEVMAKRWSMAGRGTFVPFHWIMNHTPDDITDKLFTELALPLYGCHDDDPYMHTSVALILHAAHAKPPTSENGWSESVKLSGAAKTFLQQAWRGRKGQMRIMDDGGEFDTVLAIECRPTDLPLDSDLRRIPSTRCSRTTMLPHHVSALHGPYSGGAVCASAPRQSAALRTLRPSPAIFDVAAVSAAANLGSSSSSHLLVLGAEQAAERRESVACAAVGFVSYAQDPSWIHRAPFVSHVANSSSSSSSHPAALSAEQAAERRESVACAAVGFVSYAEDPSWVHRAPFVSHVANNSSSSSSHPAVLGAEQAAGRRESVASAAVGFVSYAQDPSWVQRAPFVSHAEDTFGSHAEDTFVSYRLEDLLQPSLNFSGRL